MNAVFCQAASDSLYQSSRPPEISTVAQTEGGC